MAPRAIEQGAEPAGVEDAFIELANRLADAAAEITTKYFRQAHGPTSMRISCMATSLISPEGTARGTVCPLAVPSPQKQVVCPPYRHQRRWLWHRGISMASDQV